MSMTPKATRAQEILTLATKSGEIEALTAPLTVHVETTAGVVDSVVLPLDAYRDIEEKLEELEDMKSNASIIHARDEEGFPAELAKRFMDGDHPVRVFRQYRGMKAVQLARRIGKSPSYLSEIETGKKPGSVAVLRQIADALGVDLDDLAPTARLPLMGRVNEDGPMDRGRAKVILREHEAELRDRGVTRLSLVGSLARGDAGPASDIDILVDIDPKRQFSLIDLSGLRLYFRDLFGRETDVLIRQDLRPEFLGRLAGDEFAVF